jgi:hypothetical protein
MNDFEMIRANAKFAVEEMGPLSGLGNGFGFNRESVAWVDGYIERLRSSGQFREQQALNNLCSVFGSFLGECLIQVYGGEWRNQDGRWGVFFDNQNAAFPFSKVMKQFENGLEGGDSILGFFDLVPEVLLKQDQA